MTNILPYPQTRKVVLKLTES